MATRDWNLGDLFWRDEVLQILYWLRGEGLGDAVTSRDMVIFLGAGEALIEDYLAQLVKEGYAENLGGDPERYRLTEAGAREGGRRFADEFAGLTRQAHGECSDPECACRTLGPEACDSHAGQQPDKGRSHTNAR